MRRKRPITETDWEAELWAVLGRPVRVTYGRSRTSPLQMRPPTDGELRCAPELRGGCVVRMHSLFAAAPPEIRRAIASWMRSGRRAPRATRVMREWMNTELRELPPSPARRRALVTAGEHHDLGALAAGVYSAWFPGDFGPGRPRPELTFGQRRRTRTRSSIRLGSFHPSLNQVRIHPVLDQVAVPAWFVRSVLFHELLHAALPGERDRSGRLLHHGPEFRKREARHPDFGRALAWQRANLDALIRSARSGRPMRPLRSRVEPRGGERRGGWQQLELFER